MAVTGGGSTFVQRAGRTNTSVGASNGSSKSRSEMQPNGIGMRAVHDIHEQRFPTLPVRVARACSFVRLRLRFASPLSFRPVAVVTSLFLANAMLSASIRGVGRPPWLVSRYDD